MGEFIDKAKGRIKQAVGDLTNDRGLKREGQADELKGKVEGKVAGVKHAVEHLKDAVKDAAK